MIIAIQPTRMSVGADPATEKATPLATIGEKTITEQDLENRLAKLPFGFRETYQTPQGRQDLLRELVRIEVFSSEATLAGLDKDPQVQARLADLSKAVLAAEYAQRNVLGAAAVTDDEAKAYYQAHASELTEPEQIVAPSILIRLPPNPSEETLKQKEWEADRALEMLKNGIPFERVAEQFSDRKLDTEPFARGYLVAQIEDSVFSTPPGEITPILRVRDGFLIFDVRKHVPPRLPPFDEVREEIRQQLFDERSRKLVEELESRLFAKYAVRFVAEGDGTQVEKTVSSRTEQSFSGRILEIKLAAGAATPTRATILVDAAGQPGLGRVAVGVTGKTGISFEITTATTKPASLDSLKPGMKIRVLAAGPILQSEPARATADRIFIIE